MNLQTKAKIREVHSFYTLALFTANSLLRDDPPEIRNLILNWIAASGDRAEWEAQGLGYMEEALEAAN